MSPRVRKLIGEMMLRSPVRLSTIAKIPVLGGVLRRIGREVMPPSEFVWTQVLHGPGKGLRLELNPRVGGGYHEGAVEPKVQLALAEHLRPGMTFYDLGANIGFFTLLAARIVGDRGRVYSFEPDTETASRLRRNIQKNGFTNIAVVDAGVWSSSGMVEFLFSDSSSPDRGLGRFTTSPGHDATKPTRCVALDDFIQNAPIPDAVKCDVEGAEVEVLRGAGSLLRNHRPWIISELHSKENSEEVKRLLASYGYSLVDVDDFHLIASP
jgi:FkbM family methyltransferase